MTSRRFSLLCLSLIAVGLLASIFIALQRSRIESANRTVETVVDYDEALLFAQQKALDMTECLRMLKGAGATSVGIQEITLERLVRDGVLDLRPSNRWGNTSVLEGPDSAIAHVTRYLESKVGGIGGEVRPRLGYRTIRIPVPTDALWRTGLGLPPEALKEVAAAGLSPIARPANDNLVSQDHLRRLFSDLSQAGVTKVVFEGKSVLGFPGLLEDAALLLFGENLTYCWVEFADQMGGDKLAKLLQYRFLRLHSINPEEMLRLKPDQALNRLLRAAKERNIRLLYVHLPLFPSSDPRADPSNFIRALGFALRKDGFRLGQAQLLPDYSPPLVWVLIVLIGICASPFLLLNSCALGRPRRLAFLLAVKIAVAVGLLLALETVARPLLALVAALVFPTLSIAILLPHTASSPTLNSRPSTLNFSPALKVALLRLIGSTTISLIGGLFVAAILSKYSYFVGGQLFRGIKLAQILPLVAIFFLLIGEVSSQGRWKDSSAKIRQFMGLNLQVKHLLGLLFLLLIAAVWIMRTGNQPSVSTFPLEMKIRGFLEATLGARPRAKEFLLGHPFLLLGFLTFALARASGWRSWASALVLVGAIGQVSVVNTFCHLHSPLFLGLWRTCNGLWLGSLLGLLLALLIFRRRSM